MTKTVRNILYAVVILIVIIVIGFFFWWKKDVVKFTITGIAPVSGSAGSTALVLTGSVASSGTTDPSLWTGLTLHISTKSLGAIKTTVASTAITNGAGTIATTPIPFASAFTYTADPSDYARIYLKMKL